MSKVGVQTQNIIYAENPLEGFELLKRTGFTYVDFSLNGYLKNTDLYQNTINKFFDKSVDELKEYFEPHKKAAKQTGIKIGQMHMPYPIYIPSGKDSVNKYLWEKVAPKSMEICSFLECPYIVVHGLKMTRYLGSEDLEWEYTQRFLDYIAPMAKEKGIVICIENLYDNVAGHLVEGPCCNIHKVISRIDAMNEKYGAEILGFCFDVGHANIVGIDFESFLEQLGDRLKVLHIHDNDGAHDLHQIPFTFTKTRENNPSTDWEGFISGLIKAGFDGVFSFETAPVLKSFPEELKVNALGMIADIGRYFEKRIK